MTSPLAAAGVGVPHQAGPPQAATPQVPETGPDVTPAEPAPAVAARIEAELLREREELLLDGDAGLVRHDGRVAAVRDDLLSGDAFLHSFTEVAEVLTAGGLAFAPMPGQECRQSVVIPPGRRAEVLTALATAFAGRPVYADLLGHDVTLGTMLAERLPAGVVALERAHAEEQRARHEPPAGRPSGEEPGEEPGEGEPGEGRDEAPAEQPGEEPAVLVKGVRVYRPVVTTSRTLAYGPEHGCDLDFWDSAAPSAGAIAAIHEPPFGWWIPSLEPDSTVRIGGRDYPVPAAFAQPLLDDVTFPVDAVITWVDGSDPAWRRRRAAVVAALGEPPATGAGDERFHSRDELRYCLRSIAMYAPWIRHVFLVTDDQSPAWLRAGHPGVTVVAHRELFADPSTLPVFNSHAIESQLHRIPGLAEHFLYFNDDMFLGRPVRPEQFFQGNGSPLVNLDSRVIPPGAVSSQDDEYVAAQKNTRALVQREYGRHTTNTLSHAPYPLTRSLLRETAETFAVELAETVRTPFRAPEDLAPITLAVSVGYLTSRVGWGRIGHRYVDVDRHAALEQLPGLLRDRGIDTFCLNDGDLDQVPREEQDRQVTGFLRAYFPVPGPFERPDAPDVPGARPAGEPSAEPSAESCPVDHPQGAPAVAGAAEPLAEATWLSR
ncbi:hypothetical protein GCM10009665_62270 [Kitasatospora nipponensis]|uniref:Stealth-like protein n=1 Tax=Kitasatospora nipponensis TaxID=258049 RepID=A0ABP4HFZ3_9ACTN